MRRSSSTVFIRNVSSYRPPPDASFVSEVDDDRPIRLLVTVRPQRGQAPERDPALTKSQLVAHYRANPATLDRLFRFVAAHGLSARQTDATGNLIVLTGTYGQARRAFRPDHLGLYRKGKREFVARSGHLHLPSEIAEDVVAVMGFDNRTVPVRHFYSPQPADATANGAYEPAEVAKLYNFPSGLSGRKQTVGIIALGGGFDEDCLKDYFARKGIQRTGSLTAVSVDGTPNDASMGDDTDYNDRVREVHADIEIIGSIAPAANIVVYFASYQDITGLQLALRHAVNDPANAASVISVSWHFPEDIASGTYKGQLDSINQTLEMAKVGNVTVCVASGDYGAYEDESKPAQAVVSVPACSPFALACGGTSWPKNGAEQAWEGSGGGYSSYFGKPSYQSSITTIGTNRGVPDVSAVADPGYMFYVHGSDFPCGGTSVAAPLWAGLIALLNETVGKPVGFVNPVIYANANALTDITTGGNAHFEAAAGWDPVTGLGSPKGSDLNKLFPH